ncbi:helix-turn-helix domain-containing protein [Jiulongibacter sp. NS-SX5]|uniref:helix-turn-helix domain-containing protein n=1 Tax=Jiulongibacter sp. NS-SX5 TaxID=3463854 RepID=UPI00405812D3
MEELRIKNMVCDRCILSVSELLKTQGAEVRSVEMGLVKLKQPLKDPEGFEKQLNSIGFELLKDKEQELLEQLKYVIIDLIRNQEEALQKFTISAYLEQEIGKDYKSLSALFSSKEGKTIEHFVIAQKVERIKELLSYKELSISEIADKLHYSSVAHLSNQFKKVTGQTPSEFRANGQRIALDKL